MRQVTIKTTDNQRIIYNSNLTSFVLDQKQPFGIEYRKQCSSRLNESQLNEWWDYVDTILIERPTPNFHSIWRVVNNGELYGFEN